MLNICGTSYFRSRRICYFENETRLRVKQVVQPQPKYIWDMAIVSPVDPHFSRAARDLASVSSDGGWVYSTTKWSTRTQSTKVGFTGILSGTENMGEVAKQRGTGAQQEMDGSRFVLSNKRCRGLGIIYGRRGGKTKTTKSEIAGSTCEQTVSYLYVREILSPINH